MNSVRQLVFAGLLALCTSAPDLAWPSDAVAQAVPKRARKKRAKKPAEAAPAEPEPAEEPATAAPATTPTSEPATDAPSERAGAKPAASASAGASASRVLSPADLLSEHLALLEKKKLAPAPATRVDELDALLERAHQRELQGRKDEATMMLLEAVEGPRFRSFETLPSFAAADLMLASLLTDQRALLSAQRSVDRLLARGPDSPTYGPAFRRGVDIALLRGDYRQSEQHLAADSLPTDASDELHYLRALADRDEHNLAAATNELRAISNHSRFYARAQYLLGTQAAAIAHYEEADARFCAVRAVLHGTPRTRYASEQFDATEDLAQLGRARIAHERGESKRAADLYFAIPNDSPWLPEALFESAYASYERGRSELSLDSLQQLEARYPHSPYTAEARVLRGYVHLASCDFERAERELTEFEGTFGGVLHEIDVTLESSGRTRSLFSEQAAGLPAAASKHDQLLRGLLARDPQVERVQRELAALDAELARGGSLDGELEALAERVRGKELPRARVDEERAQQEKLREQSRTLREAVIAFADELRALRRAGAKKEELAELEKTQRSLARRSDKVEAVLRTQRRKEASEAPPPSGVELGQRLDQERVYVASARSRAEDLRERLEDALAQAERAALTRLRTRVEGELRRARLGRIDAVMGKKRKLELEVESLSAGRFPPELASSKRRTVYLRDDEEYWPFEGEDWPDEFEEQQP